MKRRMIFLLLIATLGLLFPQQGLTIRRERRIAEPDTSDTVASSRAGQVVINEFLPDPDSDWDGSGDLDYLEDEWIEIYNKGDTQLEITGWRLDDITSGGTAYYVLPQGTVIGPGQVLVFYGSETGVGLNNGGDTVNIMDDQSASVDSYQFDHSSDDLSHARIPDGADNGNTADQPTPGEINTLRCWGGGQKLVVDDDYVESAANLIDSAEDYVYVMQYMAIRERTPIPTAITMRIVLTFNAPMRFPAEADRTEQVVHRTAVTTAAPAPIALGSISLPGATRLLTNLICRGFSDPHQRSPGIEQNSGPRDTPRKLNRYQKQIVKTHNYSS